MISTLDPLTIFDVAMPTLYGEGRQAFLRLNSTSVLALVEVASLFCTYGVMASRVCSCSSSPLSDERCEASLSCELFRHFSSFLVFVSGSVALLLVLRSCACTP